MLHSVSDLKELNVNKVTPKSPYVGPLTDRAPSVVNLSTVLHYLMNASIYIITIFFFFFN